MPRKPDPVLVLAVLWLCIALWLMGCVTRAQVCVEAQHAVSPSDDWRRSNSAGASVCVDVERPE